MSGGQQWDAIGSGKFDGLEKKKEKNRVQAIWKRAID